jgi:cytochrome c peroxidase
MKMSDAITYVQQNARYMETAPKNAKYFVKFPAPYSSKTFHSGDTRELVDMVYLFAKTKQGREMWDRVKDSWKKVNEIEPEEENDED